MSHTPAPWHDDGYRIYAPTDAEDKRNGRMIVEYKHVDDFNGADAPLIAAAPELYQALLRERNGTPCGPECAGGWRHCTECDRLLKEALKKAEGNLPGRR